MEGIVLPDVSVGSPSANSFGTPRSLFREKAREITFDFGGEHGNDPDSSEQVSLSQSKGDTSLNEYDDLLVLAEQQFDEIRKRLRSERQKARKKGVTTTSSTQSKQLFSTLLYLSLMMNKVEHIKTELKCAGSLYADWKTLFDALHPPTFHLEERKIQNNRVKRIFDRKCHYKKLLEETRIDLNNQIELTLKEKSLANETASSLGESVSRVTEENARVHRLLASKVDVELNLSQVLKDKTLVQSKLEGAEKGLVETRKQSITLQTSCDILTGKLDGVEGQLIEEKAQHAACRSSLREVETNLNQALNDKRLVQSQLEGVEKELLEANKQSEALQGSCDALQSKLDGVEGSLNEAKEQNVASQKSIKCLEFDRSTFMNEVECLKRESTKDKVAINELNCALEKEKHMSSQHRESGLQTMAQSDRSKERAIVAEIELQKKRDELKQISGELDNCREENKGLRQRAVEAELEKQNTTKAMGDIAGELREYKAMISQVVTASLDQSTAKKEVEQKMEEVLSTFATDMLTRIDAKLTEASKTASHSPPPKVLVTINAPAMSSDGPRRDGSIVVRPDSAEIRLSRNSDINESDKNRHLDEDEAKASVTSPIEEGEEVGQDGIDADEVTEVATNEDGDEQTPHSAHGDDAEQSSRGSNKVHGEIEEPSALSREGIHDLDDAEQPLCNDLSGEELHQDKDKCHDEDKDNYSEGDCCDEENEEHPQDDESCPRDEKRSTRDVAEEEQQEEEDNEDEEDNHEEDRAIRLCSDRHTAAMIAYGIVKAEALENVVERDCDNTESETKGHLDETKGSSDNSTEEARVASSIEEGERAGQNGRDADAASEITAIKVGAEQTPCSAPDEPQQDDAGQSSGGSSKNVVARDCDNTGHMDETEGSSENSTEEARMTSPIEEGEKAGQNGQDADVAPAVTAIEVGAEQTPCSAPDAPDEPQQDDAEQSSRVSSKKVHEEVQEEPRALTSEDIRAEQTTCNDTTRQDSVRSCIEDERQDEDKDNHSEGDCCEEENAEHQVDREETHQDGVRGCIGDERQDEDKDSEGDRCEEEDAEHKQEDEPCPRDEKSSTVDAAEKEQHEGVAR